MEQPHSEDGAPCPGKGGAGAQRGRVIFPKSHGSEGADLGSPNLAA